eukprot:CAMPEP_0201664452 /NCGR_PEP_ID=MMETSP0494-20130426/5909_1 /ASSEMBLY_ACC=CAM_ASM_000839 /TAXON_ID=420259 /ORGANISM="Thalassiosira gravida, Strain GMp14c1" /LENGTH=702 /DNA_ID=CAMNT_0048143223 /DNA_START=109 /DNA_END=2217 /DNA_ORIENTATION=+
MITRRGIAATTTTTTTAFYRSILHHYHQQQHHYYLHNNPKKRRHYYHTTSILCSNKKTNDVNINSSSSRNENQHHQHHQQQQQHPHPHPHQHCPLTNGGTVEGVWIFHRHGDRAPNRYLGDPSHLHHESEHWYGRIPKPPPPPSSGSGSSGSSSCGDDDDESSTSSEVYDNLNKYFPPEIHASQNGGRYLDVGREPFGFLTYRGMDQMRSVGGRFRRRYERFGHRADTRSAGDGNGDGNGGGDGDGVPTKRRYSFLDHWNVQAYSTNYLRTVTSVQCFLDGLIGKSPNTVEAKNIYAGGGLKRYFKDMGKYEQLAMDVSTWTTAEDMKQNHDSDASGIRTVKIQVRDKEIDTLNAFDRYPKMMNGLVKDVIATEQFQRIDAAAKPLAETLSAYLPGLSGAPQAFGGTPSGVNWVHANDHFVCRRAHAVPLLAFSDYEGKHSREESMADMANPVCSHLAWRFREWYRSPRLLAAVAVPPFREMLDRMVEAATIGGGGGDCGKVVEDGNRKPFVLYSCHDVTLIALLYAIGADFLVSGEDDGGAGMQEADAYSGMDSSGHVSSRNRNDDVGTTTTTTTTTRQPKSWRWWPAYSSTIAFELVRLEDEEQHVIRVILNGDVVRTIPRMSVEDEGLLKEQSLSSRQIFGEMRDDDDGQSHNMMKLSDFEQLINVLEEVGGAGQDGGLFPTTEENELGEMDKIGVDGG